MPWLLANWKMMLLGVITVGAFCTGWVVKGKFVDSEQAALEKARQEMITQLRQNDAHIANILERKLQELKANEKVIERERIKVIDRPVYHNVCLDADGLQLIERARSGKTESSKPAGEVSRTK